MSTTILRLPRTTIALLLTTTLLSACGGGSDDGGVDPVLGVVPGAPGGSGTLGSYFVLNWSAHEVEAENRRNHSKYESQTTPTDAPWVFGGIQYITNAVLSSGVEYAHAAGLTGAGEIVAIIDAGFRRNHETIAGRIDPASTGGAGASAGDTSHGTGVAAIIGGESGSFIGMAPGVTFHVTNFNDEAEMETATNWARVNGAVAQNNSWGYNNTPVSFGNLNSIFFGGQNNDYIDALELYAAQGVVVFALSNDEDENDTSTGLMEGLPVLLPALESGWLAVGNGMPVFNGAGTDLTDVVRISAGCMESAEWCLFGNGSWDHLPNSTSNTSYDYGTGSSFAAPQVSGALALLAEAFPGLSPHQLRLRLLASADQSFSSFTVDGSMTLVAGFNHNYSDVFGHGFLDIAAALLPIGPTGMSMSDGRSHDISRPLGVASSAMGDALSSSLNEVEVTVSDALGADFGMSGKYLFAERGHAPLAGSLLPQTLSLDLGAKRLATLPTVVDPFAGQDGRVLGFDAPGGEFSANLLIGEGSTAGENFGVSFTRRSEEGGLSFDYGLKLARESDGLIGFGAAADEGTSMAALQLGLGREFGGGGFLALRGEVGMADIGKPDFLSEVSTVSYNALTLEVGRKDFAMGGDRLSLSVGLPMAVTSGHASIDLPTRIAGEAGTSAFEAIGLDLAPNARQIDLTLSYQMPLGTGQELLLQAVHSENAGNISGLRDDALVAAFKWSF